MRLPDLAAYHAGYYDGGRRSARVCRVHVKAPTDIAPRAQAFCGQHAWPVTHSTPMVVDPCSLPEGLTWCAKCLGRAAEHLGRLDDLAALVVDALSDPSDPTGEST